MYEQKQYESRQVWDVIFWIVVWLVVLSVLVFTSCDNIAEPKQNSYAVIVGEIVNYEYADHITVIIREVVEQNELKPLTVDGYVKIKINAGHYYAHGEWYTLDIKYFNGSWYVK